MNLSLLVVDCSFRKSSEFLDKMTVEVETFQYSLGRSEYRTMSSIPVITLEVAETSLVSCVVVYCQHKGGKEN
jgi:hypothetical protein